MTRRTFRYALVLKVWPNVEGWDDTAFAVVENTPALAAWAERRVALFKGLRAVDSDLTGICYRDCSPWIYNSHELVEEVYDEICDCEWTWRPYLTVDDDSGVPTGGGMLHINENGLLWHIYENDRGIDLVTSRLDVEDMRKWLSPVQVLVEAVRKGELHFVEQYYQAHA